MIKPIIVIISVSFMTILGAFGALLLKRGSANFYLSVKQITNVYLILGIFLYIIPLPIYLWALKNVALSVIFPINALTFVWVPLLSVKFLGERMNKSKWMGIFLIVLGVILASLTAI